MLEKFNSVVANAFRREYDQTAKEKKLLTYLQIGFYIPVLECLVQLLGRYHQWNWYGVAIAVCIELIWIICFGIAYRMERRKSKAI